MGKKDRRKRNAQSIAPDDHFAVGPLEFARFGRLVVGRSRVNAADRQAIDARLAASLPTVMAQIDTLASEIAEQVARLPGDSLLHRAWWEFAMINIKSNAGGDPDHGHAMRMIDYIQSVIASTKPAENISSNISEHEWAKLSGRVRKLFQLLNLNYQISLAAFNRSENTNIDMALEEFRHRAEFMWINVRGKRYHCHELQALEDILLPHSDVLERLFGIDAYTLIRELGKIMVRHSHGLHQAMSELHCLFEDAFMLMPELTHEMIRPDMEMLREKAFEDPELEMRRQRVSGEIFGLDLFDVGKNTMIPTALLDELTWSPGEDEDFFAPGPLRGWPLRVWPTMKRPFIRLQGRTLCFDMFALFDGFYRAIQRIIFRLEPNYRMIWNERQRAASEELPFKYLSRILPDAQIFRPVYYRWKSGDGPAQWCETDGLVIYDDHLIVVEVKAGAFTYTSPATDLPAHIKSLQNLAQGPAAQGNRFIDYLESSPEIIIADRDHKEIGRLRHSDFRQVTICAVTLDPFTDMAARAQHLTKMGVDIGKRPVWMLSVDDLRVYADLIVDPLIFLHFVEQRMNAAQSGLVDVFDEMDHLGLYLKENNYAMYAAELANSDTARLHFNGYSTPIDEYYSALLQGSSPAVPSQIMPARISEIIEVLNKSHKPRRSAIASFLLDAAADHREAIARTIDEQVRGNAELRRVRPLSTHGEHAFTLWTWSPPVQRNADVAMKHVMAVVAALQEDFRLMIELECDVAGSIVDIHWSHVSLDGLSDPERAKIESSGFALRRQRVQAAMKDHKIGANTSCPCGSGKKFKKCCREWVHADRAHS